MFGFSLSKQTKMISLLAILVACGQSPKSKNSAGEDGTAAVGEASGDLTLSYFENNKEVETSDIGNVMVSAKKNVFFIIKNPTADAASDLKIGALTDSFKLSAHNCDKGVAAGADCVIHIVFNPTAAQSYTLKLAVTYKLGGVDYKLEKEVSGKGLSPAALTLTETPRYNFGSVASGTTVDKSFTLTNAGQSFAQEIRMPTLNVPFVVKTTGTGNVTNCGQILAPSSSCTIVVTFAPTTAGSFADTLTVSYNDGKSGRSVEVALDGTGT